MALTGTHASLTRASLESPQHPVINAYLKSLKLHARTVNALFTQHATELAILERIYYINNNQHRPALFWQCVIEARRYSCRLRSLDVPLLMDHLRQSFYGDTTDTGTQSHKREHGRTTHPQPISNHSLHVCVSVPCCSTRHAFLLFMPMVHSMLTLAMQSGAFLHLVVTLTALVARLARLSSSLCRVLSTVHAECLHLLDRLYSTEATHNLMPLPLPLEGEDLEMLSLPVELTKHAVLDGELDVSVDLGEAVAWAPTLMPQSKSRSTSPILPDFLSLVCNATSIPPIESQQLGTDHALLSPSLPLPSFITVEPSSCRAVIVKKHTVPPPISSTAAEESKQKKHTKTKKVRHDEIDDIFHSTVVAKLARGEVSASIL